MAELAQKYDIQNATPDEFEVIALDLYYKGIISPWDLCWMTFDATKGYGPKVYFWFATPEDSSGRRDWIVEFEKRAERSLKVYGSVENAMNEARAAKVLKEVFDYAKVYGSVENAMNEAISAKVLKEISDRGYGQVT